MRVRTLRQPSHARTGSLHTTHAAWARKEGGAREARRRSPGAAARGRGVRESRNERVRRGAAWVALTDPSRSSQGPPHPTHRPTQKRLAPCGTAEARRRGRPLGCAPPGPRLHPHGTRKNARDPSSAQAPPRTSLDCVPLRSNTKFFPRHTPSSPKASRYLWIPPWRWSTSRATLAARTNAVAFSHRTPPAAEEAVGEFAEGGRCGRGVAET